MSYKEDLLNVSTYSLPWSKLNGCNILVTGATGLIGGCLVDLLMLNPKKDYQVYASGRDDKRAHERFSHFVSDRAFHFIQYDVLESLESDIHFDYIIHAASNASPNFFSTKPVEVIKANIIGVCNLIEYGLNNGMKRMLYVSSGEVYGEGNDCEFTEDYSGYVNPMSFRSCYPSSKRAAETLCISYAEQYGVDVVVARPCHIYGPGFTDKDNRAFAQFIRNVIANQDIVLKSDGSQMRSWCYVVDCAYALLTILLKGKNKEAYNIADKRSNLSIRNFAEIIAKLGGRKVVFDIPEETESKGYNPVSQSLFSVKKIESLGWEIKGSIEEKLESTINEFK